MAGVSSMFILLCSCLFVNSEQNVKFDSPTENRDSEIAAVLHHLNSSPFKVYNYKSATVVHAHTKADITEIVLDVSVECLNNYPDLPCTEKSLTCRGFIQGGNQVLNDVDCKPKPEIIVDEIPTSFPDSNDTKIVLSHETASSEITEPFIAVRKDKAPCLGCPFDINPNADGVDELVDLALEHVESERTHKHGLVKVIRLQQQVVAGIKYVLTLEVRPTVCLKEHQSESCPLDFDANSAVCEVTYIQKPWLSKAKHIIANNCTTSQEYVQFDGKKTEMSNEININDKPTPAFAPNFDQIAMDGSRLSDLESQIIGIDEGAPRRTVALEEVVPPTVARLETNPTPTELTSADLEVVPSLSEIDTESTLSEAPTTQIGPDSIRKRRAIPQLEKISPEEKPLVKNLADFAAAALDNIDDDNHKRVILQILGAKKMVGDDGVYYHLIMRMGISHCLEDTSNPYDNCREKLLENYTKICKVQVYVNDDYGSPKVVKSQCQNIKRDKNDNNRTNYSRYRRNVPGGQKEVSVDSDEIRSLLKLGVQHLGQLRDGNRLKPVEVVSATTQVVAGKLTRINVKMSSSDCPKDDSRELEECKVSSEATPKPCQIQIWEKEWMNFRKFTIKCEDEEKEYEIETKIRNKRQAELTLKGGQKKISSDSPEVRKLAHEGIAHYNAQRGGNKFKPVEIVSATSQVVAGSLMRIETKVSETECGQNDDKQLEDCQVSSGATPKNCHVEVWEKLWENFRKFTIKCEGEEQEYNVETKPKTKTKRQTLGAEKEIAVESEQIRNLVNEGVTHYNTKRGGNKFKPVEIVSATSQVVAGTLLRIKTKVSETECGQTDDKELEDCQVSSGATPKNCSVEIWEKLWENFRKFTIKCEGEEQEYNIETKPKTKSKRHVGAEEEVAVKSEQIRNLVNEGITYYNIQRGGNKFVPVEIVSATSQVTGGKTFRINANIALSECKEHDRRELQDCPAFEGVVTRKCRINVQEVAWKNLRKFEIKCEGGKRKYKVETKMNNFLGGSEVASSDEHLEELLERALSNLDAESKHDTKYKVQEVLSASKQIVSGHIYRIKAKIVLSDCKKTAFTPRRQCGQLESSQPKTCDFVAFEKKWDPGSRELNITCENEVHTFKKGFLGANDNKVFYSLFTDFVEKYNKNYSPEKFTYRLKVFSDNMLKIRVLNTYEQGTATYGITKFADLTQKEFSRSLGYRPELRDKNAPPFAKAKIPEIAMPVEFDWRTKGAVTEVKNQQQCGSCWAFSVTGNIEGQYAISHGNLLEFSEQELVDCDTEDQGCNGGLMDTAYRQIEKLGGLETEQDYPYDAEDEKCHFNRTLAQVQLSGAVNISQDEGEMAKWLVANGPISIAINANAMQFYYGGVSHPFKFLCNPKNLDHGVLIVGYGVHTYPLFNKTLPYWTVKNSWGTSWGEQGYYRVFRGDGTCGLNQTPSSAIVV